MKCCQGPRNKRQDNIIQQTYIVKIITETLIFLRIVMGGAYLTDHTNNLLYFVVGSVDFSYRKNKQIYESMNEKGLQ